MATETQRQAAWDVYYANHPEVRASWGHQNGRWPSCGCQACQDSRVVEVESQSAPEPAEETHWVRTNRRVLEGFEEVRRPGPWHQMHDSHMTWCGKRPQKLLSSQEQVGGYPQGNHCTSCVRQVAKGQPKPWRR